MKKVIIALLVVASLFAFVSCKEAEEVVEPVVEKTDAELVKEALEALAPKYATKLERTAANGWQFETTYSSDAWNEVAPDYYRIDRALFEDTADAKSTDGHKYSSDDKYVGFAIDFTDLLKVTPRGSVTVSFLNYNDQDNTTWQPTTYDEFNEFAGLKFVKDDFASIALFKVIVKVGEGWGAQTREIYFKTM